MHAVALLLEILQELDNCICTKFYEVHTLSCQNWLQKLPVCRQWKETSSFIVRWRMCIERPVYNYLRDSRVITGKLDYNCLEAKTLCLVLDLCLQNRSPVGHGWHSSDIGDLQRKIPNWYQLVNDEQLS